MVPEVQAGETHGPDACRRLRPSYTSLGLNVTRYPSYLAIVFSYIKPLHSQMRDIGDDNGDAHATASRLSKSSRFIGRMIDGGNTGASYGLATIEGCSAREGGEISVLVGSPGLPELDNSSLLLIPRFAPYDLPIDSPACLCTDSFLVVVIAIPSRCVFLIFLVTLWTVKINPGSGCKIFYSKQIVTILHICTQQAQ